MMFAQIVLPMLAQANQRYMITPNGPVPYGTNLAAGAAAGLSAFNQMQYQKKEYDLKKGMYDLQKQKMQHDLNQQKAAEAAWPQIQAQMRGDKYLSPETLGMNPLDYAASILGESDPSMGLDLMKSSAAARASAVTPDMRNYQAAAADPAGFGAYYNQQHPSALKEVYSPTSPTGIRYVPANEAPGLPAPPPSSVFGDFSMDYTPDQGFHLSSGKGGKNGLAKPTQNEVQKRVINAGDILSSIDYTRKHYMPDFQTFGTKFNMMLKGYRDKMIPLEGADKAQFQEYTTHVSEAAQRFSNILKELSGVAVNPAEYDRAQAWIPNAGTHWWNGDSPAEFEAKVDRMEDFYKRAIAKYSYINSHQGLTLDDVSVDDMPRIMRERGEILQSKFEDNGLTGDALHKAVLDELSKEFGIPMN